MKANGQKFLGKRLACSQADREETYFHRRTTSRRIPKVPKEMKKHDTIDRPLYGDGVPVYQEFYGSGPNAGQVLDKSHGGLYVDISVLTGFPFATGVAVSPDGESLYFVAGAENSSQVLIETDLTGNVLGIQPISSSYQLEEIGVVIPQ